METELKEVGLTFALGGLAFYGFWQIIRMVGRPDGKSGIFTSLLNDLRDQEEDKGTITVKTKSDTVVEIKLDPDQKQKTDPSREAKCDIKIARQIAFVALIFALGFMLEHVSKKVSSERDPQIYSPFFNLLDKDKDLRLKSLFDVPDPGWLKYSHSLIFPDDSDTIVITQKSIFMDLKYLANNTNTPDFQIAKHMSNICYIPSKHLFNLDVTNGATVDSGNVIKFKKEINDLYDFAKNRVYKEDTYNRELQELYGKVSFSRSCAFLLLLLGITFLSLLIFCGVATLMKGCNSCSFNFAAICMLCSSVWLWCAGKYQWAWPVSLFIVFFVSPELRHKRSEAKKLPLKCVVGFLICAVGFCLASITFREAHTSMDLRVMGYYMTLNNDYLHEHNEQKCDCDRPAKSPDVSISTNTIQTPPKTP